MSLRSRFFRVIIDPNVLTAAAISPNGSCARLLELAVGGDFTLVGSPHLLDELADVLPRVGQRRRTRLYSLPVVEEWLGAVNRGDGVRLEQLTQEEVEIVGQRGSGRADRTVLWEWLTRAGFSAESLRWFCGGDGSVVVEQDARWIDVATGQEQGHARVASRFRVDQNRIAKYVRHDDGLLPALTAARVRESDEVIDRRAI